MYGGQFTYLQAGKEASKGQQYAELVGEKVKLEGVDAEEVTDKTGLDEITGNDADKGWEYTYEISEGTEDEDGNVFKVATIKIYKEGENSPRYTYEVPLSSSGSGAFLKGMIIPYYGEIEHIPQGWLLCDGTNGTPDLRGKVLIGTGTTSDEWGSITYALGDIGGERLHKLTIEEMPSHSHKTKIGDGYQGTGWVDQSGEAYYGWLDGYIGATGGDKPHNIMQPYMAINYIMKI